MYRISPLIRNMHCLTINPYKDNIHLCIYPSFVSDRSLWYVDPVFGLNSTFYISNVCHQDYALKRQKDNISIRPLLYNDRNHWFNIRKSYDNPDTGSFIAGIRPFNCSKFVGTKGLTTDPFYWIFLSVIGTPVVGDRPLITQSQ